MPIFRFGDCELDEELYQVRRGGQPVDLEPRAYDLLHYLVRHRDRVVPKDELLAEVWSGVLVGEAVLPHGVASLRRALGDDRKRQAILRTVHGRGYRFVADLDPSAMHEPATRDESPSLLEAASVLQHPFPASLLQRLVGDSTEPFLAALEGSLSRGELRPSGAQGLYELVDPELKRSLYDRLRLSDRIRLHERAAQLLEAKSEPLGLRELEEIAHHAFEAAAHGAGEEAVRACERVARRHVRARDYAAAAHWLEKALQALDFSGGDDSKRSDLLLDLAEAHLAGGDRVASHRALETAVRCARRIDDWERLARAVIVALPPYALDARLEAPLRELLARLRDVADSLSPDLRARITARQAVVPTTSLESQAREPLTQEAIGLAQSCQDLEAQRDAWAARLRFCLGPDRLSERLRAVDELLTLATRSDDPWSAYLGHREGFVAHLLRGDRPGIERALGAVDRLAVELRQPAACHWAQRLRGCWAQARGELDAARQAYDRALEIGEGLDDRTRFLHAGSMFLLMQTSGQADSSGSEGTFFGEMLELPYPWQLATRIALATSLVVRGDRAAAAHELAFIDTVDVTRLPHDEHWLSTLEALTQLSIALHDSERATVLYDLLLPYEALFVVHDDLPWLGHSVAGLLGQLQALSGNFTRAVEHLEMAAEREAALGLEPALCETRACHGIVLGRRGASEDGEKSERLRRQVEADYDRLGMRRPARISCLEAAVQALQA